MIAAISYIIVLPMKSTKYEKYESLLISNDALEFKFISEGPKGEIEKVV